MVMTRKWAGGREWTVQVGPEYDYWDTYDQAITWLGRWDLCIRGIWWKLKPQNKIISTERKKKPHTIFHSK